jgi:hypothetical protein
MVLINDKVDGSYNLLARIKISKVKHLSEFFEHFYLHDEKVSRVRGLRVEISMVYHGNRFNAVDLMKLTASKSFD